MQSFVGSINVFNAFSIFNEYMELATPILKGHLKEEKRHYLNGPLSCMRYILMLS